MKKMTKIFPITLAILDLAASGVYLFNGDIPRAVYWLSAASITFSTLFIK